VNYDRRLVALAVKVGKKIDAGAGPHVHQKTLEEVRKF
jgi:hypothetical protein